MKQLITACLLLMLFVHPADAQNQETMNSADILLRLKKLQVLGSVLYIAAHPDDENTRLLAWLSTDKLYRTGYLSLTRGDGGQNLIGDEQGIELGLIRTQELLAARRVDGAEQFFSRAYDFGFSKTTTESLHLWGQQKILSDVVWIIRKFQPDIIITRFPEDKRAGHGQHSASSILARMAFAAAADPKQFPEQFAFGVQPWQARRLFWNNYNFGSVNTTRDDQLKIEVGGFNPLVGKSYGEVAADSRSQHRSQGFGVPHSRGNSTEYFSLTAGEKADSALMQQVDCSWNRISGGNTIGGMIHQMIVDYDASAPIQSLKALVKVYKKIKDLPPGYWREKKMAETLELIQACTGLWLDATVNQAYGLQNQTISVTVRVLNRSSVAISLLGLSINQQDTSWKMELKPGFNYSLVRTVSLRNLPISQPYWLIDPMSPGSYNVHDQTLIGLPQNPATLEAVFKINLLGESVILRRPVMYQYTEPVRGELYEPFCIVPYLMASLDPELLVFNKDTEKKLEIKRQIKSATEEGMETTTPSASEISLTSVPQFEITSKGATSSNHDFLLKSNENQDLRAGIWATQIKNLITDTLLQCRTIFYEHIPRIDYFKPAKATLVSVNLKIRGTRIGYIEGAGDKVPDALTAMGYSVVKLRESAISAAGLQGLDAVITGVRAFDVHDWLTSKHAVLMEYIKNGGNLIVQYNRNLGEDETGIGPYPFGISNTRVTEEDAAVHFLQPAHPVLHFPNEITENDFQGWVQERGIYFASHPDPKYQAIFSMKDSGETQDQSGSLLIGSYGKGNFAYTGLVFFRELPAGVPGAYRLLANLIALQTNSSK